MNTLLVLIGIAAMTALFVFDTLYPLHPGAFIALAWMSFVTWLTGIVSHVVTQEIS